jgi:murein DD-endopeptidase MepM/ murein hydrolase activator NlpD
MDDIDFKEVESLFSELKQLFGPGGATKALDDALPSTPETPLPGVPGSKTEQQTRFQSPIHGSYESSGGFSTTATDPRHPHGHIGADLRVPGGTLVYGFGSGIVSSVGTDPKGGNIVLTQHPGGIKAYYAHLGSVAVQKGQPVDTNTVIGTVGNTGDANVTWPHLHFGVMVNGGWVDPARFIPVPAYTIPGKDAKMWLPSAKEKAEQWSMQEHLAKRTAATKARILNKACLAYQLLTNISDKY